MFNQQYVIKWAEEAAWGVALAVVTYVGAEMATADFETLDWKAFVVAVAVGSVRVAAATVVNSIRKLLFGGE